MQLSITATIMLELEPLPRSRTGPSPSGLFFDWKPIAGRTSATRIPEKSAIHGPKSPKICTPFRVLSDITGRPHIPTPKSRKRNA